MLLTSSVCVCVCVCVIYIWKCIEINIVYTYWAVK